MLKENENKVRKDDNQLPLKYFSGHRISGEQGDHAALRSKPSQV